MFCLTPSPETLFAVGVDQADLTLHAEAPKVSCHKIGCNARFSLE